ncbi:hypothetical protein M0812_11647 [Anaeramoeba flamelloides]|uniref:RGS domain-containing protein n=1 Tax=Anaeramoeba flamelloides TaxID=1746091 RepID=A0AAV7ZWR8_9EUKA|nr:hypothetical protein M0812_11647 [Anaeramoeba flamelloides]
MDNSVILLVVVSGISVIFELTLFYFFMKRRNVSPINVRSKTLTSIFTVATSLSFLILVNLNSNSHTYSCQTILTVAFFHQTFTIWIFIVQAWRVHFIYLLNKEKLKSIKRFIKNVNTDSTTSTSRERKTIAKSLEGNESSILNSVGESNFWEGIIEEDDGDEIDKKFQKVEKKFYQKRIQISGKYMFFAILFHFIFMLIIISLVHIEDKTERKPNGDCTFGTYFLPLIIPVSLIHIVLFSYYLFKIWKIKDNFKIRNQLYMIFSACILSIAIMASRNTLNNKKTLWEFTFGALVTWQYLVVLGYPLWLSRKSYNSNKELNKNEESGDTIEKFKHILTDKKKSKYFFKFLQLDYSIENLLFYQAVTSFEKNQSKKKIKKKKILPTNN